MSSLRPIKKPHAAGGWRAIHYSFQKAREAGGFWKLIRALRSPNTCKTCALGMGGQKGGMVNESGHRFEVCKKSIQAMVADMQGRVPATFFSSFSVQQMKAMTPYELEHAGRLVEPMFLAEGASHYEPISWEAAYQKIAKKMHTVPPTDAFFYCSGRSSNEAAYLLKKLARQWGTPHVNNCSYYCHQASSVGLKSVTGSGTATLVLEDLDTCDFLMLLGANPSSNHPRLLKNLVEIRRRGGKVIVVNPVKELGLTRFRVPSDWRSLLFGSSIASEYVQPHIGGDLAFLMGVAKGVLELGKEDLSFLENHTQGFDDFKGSVEQSSWETLEEHSGVPIFQMKEVAVQYAQSKNAVFSWAMGITHHAHGVNNVRAIGNLALLRGMVGKKGAGLLPLRGHSNVQGIGSVGVVPGKGGLDTLGCMEKAAEGKMQLAWCLGGNLYGSNPESAWATKALGSIDLVVQVSTTLNTGHAWGVGKETLILPVKVRDEDAQTTTQESMFNYVRVSSGGAPRHEGPRGEVDVVCDLADLVFPKEDWEPFRSHDSIRKVMAQEIAGYASVYEKAKKKEEFFIPGRTLHQPKFSLPGGRAQMHATPLPKEKGTTGDAPNLRLMSVRSEGQFNTVVYEETDLYRGQERRDVLLMNADDMAHENLKENQRVTVKSEVSQLKNILVRAYDIRQGNALMYYPEANALYPRFVDPESRTPAFKNVAIQIIPEGNLSV